MKLTKVGSVAALGLVGAAASAPAPQVPRSVLLQGPWKVEIFREGCDDRTSAHLSDVWSFGPNGRFDRSRLGADGTTVHQAGRYVVQYNETELDLLMESGDGGRTHETYAILSLDGTRLELLSPTDMRQGVVITQERYAAFFHS